MSYREKHAERMREYRRRNPEKSRRYMQDYFLRKKYGLTYEQVEAKLEEQDGRCASCGRPLESNGPRRMVVDHCHDSGKVRGLICCSCNRTIGHAQEDADRLEACANYLRRRK